MKDNFLFPKTTTLYGKYQIKPSAKFQQIVRWCEDALTSRVPDISLIMRLHTWIGVFRRIYFSQVSRDFQQVLALELF